VDNNIALQKGNDPNINMDRGRFHSTQPVDEVYFSPSKLTANNSAANQLQANLLNGEFVSRHLSTLS
jgi:hypothetical protein